MFFTEKNVLRFWAIIWFLPYEIFYSPWNKHWCLIKGEGKKQVTTKHENSRRKEMRLAPTGWMTVPTGTAARAGSSLPGFLLPAKGQYGVVFCNRVNTPVQPWLSQVCNEQRGSLGFSQGKACSLWRSPHCSKCRGCYSRPALSHSGGGGVTFGSLEDGVAPRLCFTQAIESFHGEGPGGWEDWFLYIVSAFIFQIQCLINLIYFLCKFVFYIIQRYI